MSTQKLTSTNDKTVNTDLNHKLVIGVTGGIGSGKSALTKEFELLNIVVVDADVVAREVVAVNSPTLKVIAQTFGEDILLVNGELNRAKLRALIFSDEQSKTKLNNIMHPAIRQCLLEQLQTAQSPYVILSAPLLFENSLDMLTDKVIVVDVDESIQLSRAAVRDNVEQQQIKSIMASQWSRQQRIAKADYLVVNNGALSALKAEALKLHTELFQISADR